MWKVDKREQICLPGKLGSYFAEFYDFLVNECKCDSEEGFHKCLERWVEKNLLTCPLQDKFVHDVELNWCLSYLRRSKCSKSDITSGFGFCYYVCETAFLEVLSWERG